MANVTRDCPCQLDGMSEFNYERLLNEAVGSAECCTVLYRIRHWRDRYCPLIATHIPNYSYSPNTCPSSLDPQQVMLPGPPSQVMLPPQYPLSSYQYPGPTLNLAVWPVRDIE
jgi:hypothetical protein